jgi:hypothetical protein
LRHKRAVKEAMLGKAAETAMGVICKSRDLIRRSMSDFAIHRTADIIGERIDSGRDASCARAGKAGAPHP